MDARPAVGPPYGQYGASRTYRSSLRWHRAVAWVLAVVMGIGVVALAFSAVYRGAAGSRQDPAPPPASTEVDGQQAVPPGELPSGSGNPVVGTGSAHRREH